MDKFTPLYETHVAEGGKIVPFAGYLLPVQYGTGVVAEHMAVRTKCGLFDVSHMGEVAFTGPGALPTLNHLLTNDFTNMTLGRVRYSVMCNERGGCVDDVLVYKFGPESYLVVVNAANKDKDVAWMGERLLPGCQMEDLSDGIAQLALQGPAAPAILGRLVEGADAASGAGEASSADAAPSPLPAKYYTAVRDVDVAGIRCMISRTGYTGELGYELYCAAADAPELWRLLREAGAEDGLIPCGLGARDTLRMEAAMPLYGHEMDETVTPLEAGLDFAVRLGKDFVGRDAILAAGAPQRTRVGLWVTGRGVIREHQDVWAEGVLVGRTTSGTHCPYVKHAIGMALVDVRFSQPGCALEVDVRGRRVSCEVVPLPFYTRA